MVVGIFSRDSEVNYRWLTDFLRTLSEEVDSVYIGNTFRPNTERYNFAILYHSMTRGRINITDVADALYDEELRTLSSALGQKKVIVVIDDLHNNNDEEQTRILETQPSIGKMAQELLLFSKETKQPTDTNRINISNKEKIKKFIPRSRTRDVLESLKNFRLSDCKGNKGYTRVLLQLFGLPGNGKSSFINSCKYVIDGGRLVQHAEVSAGQGGKTTMRMSYELSECICMVDNRGLPRLDGLQTGEIFAQLANLLLPNKEVEWGEDFNENLNRLMVECSKGENLGDLIIPVFVHSVEKEIQRETSAYTELLKMAKEFTGTAPYVVLTHKNSAGVDVVRSAFKDMGIKKIFAIENYTSQDEPMNRQKNENLVTFLDEVLKDIKEHIKEMKSPKEEREKRLKLIEKFMKEKKKWWCVLL